MVKGCQCSSNDSIQEQVANIGCLEKYKKMDAIHRVKSLSMSDGQSQSLSVIIVH